MIAVSSFIIHHSVIVIIMRPSVPDVHITDPEDAELAAYRALAGQAVLGLIFGLLSPLVLVDPLLWSLFPALGVILSGWALRRIKKSDSLTGRKMALDRLAALAGVRRGGAQRLRWPTAGRSATRPGSSPPYGSDSSPKTSRRRPTN